MIEKKEVKLFNPNTNQKETVPEFHGWIAVDWSTPMQKWDVFVAPFSDVGQTPADGTIVAKSYYGKAISDLSVHETYPCVIYRPEWCHGKTFSWFELTDKEITDADDVVCKWSDTDPVFAVDDGDGYRCGGGWGGLTVEQVLHKMKSKGFDKAKVWRYGVAGPRKLPGNKIYSEPLPLP